ncbi:MAG: hypothetical protein QMD14_02600, partial [Candidatus Aenigmarchaeota archaeon]|nr:hypothetical protein [Candidatus Aenigmarchaeota archaeon]
MKTQDNSIQKIAFILCYVFLGMILSSGIVFAQQPTGSVKITSIDYTLEIPAGEANASISILTNATLQNIPIAPINNHPNYTATGTFNWTINTADVVLAIPYTVALNLTLPASNTNFGWEIVGTNTTQVNITLLESIGTDRLRINLDLGANDTDAILSVNLTWNVTISTDSNVYQLTPSPAVDFATSNITDVKYLQNFTVIAPFSNNVTLNVTLPDANVVLNEVFDNSTVATKSDEYVWFDCYNVASGTSPQVNYTAEKIVTLTTNERRVQGSAEINKNVTWESNYTIDYNSSFSQLKVENLILNHTLWP